MSKPTTKVDDDEELKGKKTKISFEKDDVLPNIVNKGLVMLMMVMSYWLRV